MTPLPQLEHGNQWGKMQREGLCTAVEEIMALQKGSTENLLMFYELCLEVRPHVRVPLGIYSIILPQETPRAAACR